MLKAKFFEVFWVLYPVDKQAYKIELSKKWRIYNVFHLLLLEQNTIRKGHVDKQTELKTDDSKK